jgi:hypothetical protein
VCATVEKRVAAGGGVGVGSLVNILERNPTVRSVAALLTYKLQNGETPPGADQGRCKVPDEGCPQCGGTGRIKLDVPETDPAYGREYPCGCVFRG